MKEHFTPIQQKRGRVPIHLLVKVENENEKNNYQKKIIKPDNCSSEHFMSPVVFKLK